MKPGNYSFPSRRCRLQSVGEIIREIFNTSREAAQVFSHLPLSLSTL